MDTQELQRLIDATGLSYKVLGHALDANPKVVMAWYTGNRKPRHPKMVKKALQMLVLERSGRITDALILRTVELIEAVDERRK